MKLFIAGLPYDFDDTDLKEMLELYGEVKSARVATDRDTGKSKGFGFVEMMTEADAKEAIAALDGAKLRGGKQLAVKKSEEQPKNAPFGNRRPNDRPGGGDRGNGGDRGDRGNGGGRGGDDRPFRRY